jgi:Domain of unknown function (DUF222)/HNH endonuclease
VTALAEAPADQAGAHAWADAVAAASAALTDAFDVPGWSLRDAQVPGLVDAATRLVAQAQLMQALVVAEAARRGIPKAAGSPSVAAWLRVRQGLSPRAARQVQTLADSLHGAAERSGGHRCADTARRMAEGTIHAEQAAAIAHVLDEAPESAGPDTKAEAERLLLGYASQIDAVGLRRLGAHVWAVLDPAAADAHEARRLAAQEARAAARRRLSFYRYGDGSTGISGCLPDAEAALVRTALDPLAKPSPAADDAPDPRTPTQRNADALVELAHRVLDTGLLPESGGQATQVVVTIEERAVGRLGSCDRRPGYGEASTGPPIDGVPIGPSARARLDDGTILSDATTSWLTCDAELIWAIKNSAGLVTKLGRTRRYFTGAARRAVILRDSGHCAFPGCDRPASWCHVHHIRPWKDGGSTDPNNGVLLCGWHHRLVHHTDTWAVIADTDGHPTFIPPPWVDPARRPLRNIHAPPPSRE